jgi:transposase
LNALPGEKCAAKLVCDLAHQPSRLVCDLAHQLLALDDWIEETDREIRETFRLDERAEVIETLPGMGPVLGAEFLAIVGDLFTYADAGRLAAHAGLAPVSREGPGRSMAVWTAM